MPTLGQRLAQEHRALEALYEQVANRVHCGDTALLDASWTELETKLRAHLEFEERHLFARFEQVDPVETARLRDEHAAVRRELAEMGVAIEVHALREEDVEGLLAMLRAHGAREEALLYPWASATVWVVGAAVDPREGGSAGA